MDSSIAIAVTDLCKTYRDGLFKRRRFEALRGVSFEVSQGEIFGLLGRNGAGKTTFIKILLGIISKSGGQATMLGLNSGSRLGRQQVGYLPENLAIPRHLTGNHAMEYYGHLSNLSNAVIRERREELLHLVGLADRAKDSVRKYSKGMLQRLGLAQAMLHDPKLLILDEPTDGLDPQARADVRDILRRLRDRGTTIFLNSHILQEVELVCDRVAILDQGSLRYCGEVSELGAFVRSSGAATIGAKHASEKVAQELQVPLLEIDLQLIGSEADVRESLAGTTIIKLEVRGNGQVYTKCRFPSQVEVDQCVDALRHHSISLVAMSPHQTTLEDAFLQLLNQQN